MTGPGALLAALFLAASCSASVAVREPIPAPPLHSPTEVAVASPSPTSRPYQILRVFVASEMGDVWVLEAAAGQEFSVVAKIAVGAMSHNIAVSPDARWVASANRMANSVSIIDPYAVKEIAKAPVGRQPHDLTFSPDSATLFVGHERDTVISRIEVGTWKPLMPLRVGVPQHDLAIHATRPTELYYSLTNTNEPDVLRVYHLDTDTVTKIRVDDVHDAFYVPDASEVWSASSGFIDMRSDRLVIYDPEAKRVKEEIHFPGRYPFHTMKQNRDGIFFPPDTSIMLLSDHAGPSLLYVDWKRRAIVGETKVGPRPFHTTYDPLGDRLLVTSNKDGMVRVIDRKTREVVQKIAVPMAHGIVAMGVR